MEISRIRGAQVGHTGILSLRRRTHVVMFGLEHLQ